MTTKDSFFYDQTDLTAYKIFFYEHYVKIWLIKLLMQKGSCFVADLFCGPGMNGTQIGSPIALAKEANAMISAKAVNSKHANPSVHVLFSDSDKLNIEKLKAEIVKLHLSKNIFVGYESKPFTSIVKDLKSSFASGADFPKFFFLDPFTYSSVKMSEIKSLMELNNAEIMLFLPTFHAYRFSKADLSNCKKLADFLGEFTCDGSYSDINGFINSIKKKIEKSVPGVFVRPVVLDGGRTKNCLFLLTKNYTGVNAMNDLVWKTSGEMLGINLARQKTLEAQKSQQKLLDLKEPHIEELEKYILDSLDKGRSKTNRDFIIETILLGYRLPDLNAAMNNLKKSGKITLKPLGTSKANTNYLTIDSIYGAKTVFSLTS